jgi:drug/metabolite transporter (DMT)-like permease
MYIGLGIILLVIGLIFVLDVIQVDLQFIDDSALGWILVIAGALAIVLSLVVAPPWRRPGTTYDPPVR